MTARSSTSTPSRAAIKQLWAGDQVHEQEGRPRRREPEGGRPAGRPAVAAPGRAEQVARLPGPGLHPDARRAGGARLPPARGGDGQHGDRVVRGLLVAASRDMVLNAVHAASASRPHADHASTVTSFAVLRSLARTDHLGMGGEVEALVDVGAKVTNIVVHEGGVPRFVRILLMGGQDITDAVAERVGVPVAAGRGDQAAARPDPGPRPGRGGSGHPGAGSSSGHAASTRSGAASTTTWPPRAPARSAASS